MKQISGVMLEIYKANERAEEVAKVAQERAERAEQEIMKAQKRVKRAEQAVMKLQEGSKRRSCWCRKGPSRRS
jgi:hypothetical protein